MEKNKNCSACSIKLDINNYKKDRTICKDCYNKKKRKININTLPKIKLLKTLTRHNNQKLKLTITIEHYRSVLVFQVKYTLCWKFLHE